ncbi:MAG: MFS transporter [Anaerolineae bacterium]|nr:MFS transporter [Anaerolineae bacterium]
MLAHPLLRTLLAAPAVAVLFVAIYGILLPAWAVEVLHGDATVNGLLQSARGAGSLIGALLIASLAHLGQRGRWLTLGTFWYPALILVFALTRTLPLSMAALVGVGLGGMMVYNMANALVQSQVSDEFRGRVMSVYSLIMFGGMPLGSLWAGTAAHFLGAPLTLTLGAGVALACAAAFWFLAPQLRRLS